MCGFQRLSGNPVRLQPLILHCLCLWPGHTGWAREIWKIVSAADSGLISRFHCIQSNEIYRGVYLGYKQ